VRLYAATSNPAKLAEFRQGAPEGIEIVAAGPVDCPETGASFEENARQKALCYAAAVGDLVFADDSGLEVDLLGGAPGIYSARYAGENAGDAENRARLLRELGGRRAAARFVCVIAVARPGEVLAAFRGDVEGVILDSERGELGFGYDPLFYYPPLGRTFAEMTAEEKFACSHRGQAFREMTKKLGSL
jgi:XTP/dITP diphosphohydrolase